MVEEHPAESAVNQAEKRSFKRDRYPVPPICGIVGKRFIPSMGIALFVWAISWPFLTLGFVNHYGSPDADWIEAQYQRKDLAVHDSAQSARSRLFIVGGSEALFGVDAELMQRKLGVTTINYATHAGLGTYLLDRARRVMRPGDSVLLCPAYEVWYEDAVSNVEWDYVATYDKRFFFSTGIADAVQTLYSVPGSNYYDSLIGWGKRLIGRYQDERSDYNVATMDANGDLRGPIAPEPFRSGSAYQFPRISDDAGANAEFYQFARWARQNRIRVFYSWPNRCAPEPFAPEDRMITPGLKAMFDAWGFIVLNNPGDTCYPKQWFVDTIYHADAGCRRIRTEALTRALRPYFDLPPVSPQPKGIYLVTSQTCWLNDRNAFANQPDVRAKYLTREKLDCPDDITPAELREWSDRGEPIWYDDPAIAPLLPSGQWDTREVRRMEQTIGDWVKRYDHHLFLFARARGGIQDKSPLPLELLPNDLLGALEGPSPAIAVTGTGPWTSMRRVMTDSQAVFLRSSLEELVGQKVPHLALSLCASRAGSEGSWISINGRRFSSSKDGQLCVVVIEPIEGVVADAAAFAGGAPEVVWSLKQLFPRQVSLPASAR